VTTQHPLYIPTLTNTSSVRKFCRDTQETARVVGSGLYVVSDQCVADWKDLPLDRGRIGSGPERRAVRQLRYIGKLLWRTHDAAGLFYADYMALIAGPLQAGAAKRPKWNVNA
jgi:hypothetical protein